MGLILRAVPAAIVTRAKNLPLDDPMHMCDLSRWELDWVAIFHVHKRIAITDLCRPSDIHKEQRHAAALPHTHALLKFLDASRKYWSTTLAVHSTVLASIKALYFLHRVRFGGLPARGLLEDGLSEPPAKTGDTDTSDDENPHSAPEHWGKRGTRQGTLL